MPVRTNPRLAGQAGGALQAQFICGGPSTEPTWSRRVSDEIDLNSLARRIERVLSDIGMLRHDMTVMTALVSRQDATMTALLDELRAVHQQIKRMNDRVHKLEQQE
jgi:hypothetical protein